MLTRTLMLLLLLMPLLTRPHDPHSRPHTRRPTPDSSTLPPHYDHVAQVDLQYLSASALPDLLRAISGGGDDDGGSGGYLSAEIELLQRRLATVRAPDAAGKGGGEGRGGGGGDKIHIATFVAWWHHGTLPPPPPRPPPSPVLVRHGSDRPPLEGPLRPPSLKQLAITTIAAARIHSVLEPDSPPVLVKEGSIQNATPPAPPPAPASAPASAPAPAPAPEPAPASASPVVPALSLSASSNQDLVIQFNTHQRKGVAALKLELGFGGGAGSKRGGLNESSQDQDEDEEGRSSGGGGVGGVGGVSGSGNGSGGGGGGGLAGGSSEAEAAVEAEAVAKWLLSAKGLSKRKVGEYLGGIDPFQQMVLGAFMQHPDNDFTGMALDEALRALLVKFRLPGEAQQISRVLESFGARSHACNPSMFR